MDRKEKPLEASRSLHCPLGLQRSPNVQRTSPKAGTSRGRLVALFMHHPNLLTNNPAALQRRNSLISKERCSKEDSNLHRFPY